MTKRDLYGYFAVLLAFAACAGLVWYAFYAPHYLKIAVAPPDTGLTRYLQALSSTLEKERATVRLQVIQLATQADVKANIAAKKSHLAVVRSDSPLPASSLSVASFQDLIVLTMARPGAGITSFTDLAGKNIAVIGRPDENSALLNSIAQLHGMAKGALKITPAASASEAAELAEEKKVDAIFAVAPRGSPDIARAYDQFTDAFGGPAIFVPLSDFKTLPGVNPAFTKSELAPGEIKATPKTPEKTVRTFTFPALIIARSSLRANAIEEFTKNLFSLRLALASQYPAAARLTALPTKRDAAFPLHPGAAIYYDASEVSFLEKYSDLMWLALFGFSGIASIFVWFWRLAIPKGRILINNEREKLASLITRARQTQQLAELDAIEVEADALVVSISNQLFDGTLEAERQPSFDLLLNRLAAIIESKRKS